MKKSVSLKLIVFSFLLVTASVSYSAPEFQAGTGTDSTIAGVDNEASGEKSLAFGYNNTASGSGSSAFGQWNEANGGGSSAFGHSNLTNGTASSAFGYNNKASEKYSSAFGVHNTASGERSSAFGNQYKVTGEASGAFGVGKVTGSNPATGEYNYDYVNEGKDSYMIGNYNRIASGSNNNFILGNNVSIGSGIQNSVALGNNSTVSSSNEVSVGSATQKRKITNVADGTNDSDAATVGQVKNLKNDVNNVKNDVNDLKNDMTNVKGKVSALGANMAGKVDTDASNLTDANVTKWREKLKIANGTVNSATGTGSTGLGVDNTVTGEYSTAVGYKNKVTGNKSGAFGDPNLVTGNGSYAFGNDNTVKGDNNFVFGNNVTIDEGIQNSVALGNNSTVSSSNEVSVGSKGKERKITNVADGEVSANSTDAVNGRQLYNAMQNSNENLKNEVNEKIDDVKDEVNHVGSLSAALAGLHPMQYDPKAPTQVMAALGNYKNKQSVAVGLSYYFNDRFMMSAGVAIGSEKRVKSMANVGFTLKLGKGSGVTYEEAPQYTILDEVKRLTVENQDLKSKINNQDNRIKEQDEKIKNLEEKLNKLLKNK
ncbi:YadA-like family protein [Fusobacterium animalis]|uniref:YadA-like family protein n=1 Tax=Fusobacterium animalis TaxID=76859 RepID=UPI0030CBEFFC